MPTESGRTDAAAKEKLLSPNRENSQKEPLQKKEPVAKDRHDSHQPQSSVQAGDGENRGRAKEGGGGERDKRSNSHHEGEAKNPRDGHSQRPTLQIVGLPGGVQPSPNGNGTSRSRDRQPGAFRPRSCSNPNPHFCRVYIHPHSNGDVPQQQQQQHHHQQHQQQQQQQHALHGNHHGPRRPQFQRSLSADDRHKFVAPPSPALRQKAPYFTPPTSPTQQKNLYFTPPQSPGVKSQSTLSLHTPQSKTHQSLSTHPSQSKSHQSLSTHSHKNGKKPHSSRSENSEEEKCLPQHQMESIMRQMASGKVTTDSMVNNFGGCGPFQVLLVLATYAAQISAVWGVMFMAFGNYHPKWWCYEYDEDALNDTSSSAVLKSPIQTLSTSKLPNGSLVDGISSEAAELVAGGRSKYVNPATGGVWKVRAGNGTGTCSIVQKCPAVRFDPTSSTVASEWTLICEEAWSQSAIISIQMTGVLVGACLGGFIGDRRGRKVTLYGHLFFMAVFNILAIFSPSWQVFAFFRFLIGDCVGAILACCIIYPMEFVDMWWRGILGALPVWNVGAVSFSVAVWLLKDWKQLHIATAVLSLLIFIPVFWVPESMRWLAVHGKVEDAKCIANKIASMNGRSMPNTTVLEIIAKEERRMSRLKGTYSKYTVLDLFADRFIRRISIRMGIVWCFMSAAYYALSFGIKNFSGDFYINFIAFSAAEVPGMLFVAPATNKLGRRLGSVVYFASTTVCCAAVVVVSFAATASVRGTIITVLAMLAKMHILGVWMMVTVFCTELYPTVIRNLSIGYLNACARVGGIAAPFLLPDSSDFLFVSFLIIGGLMVTCCYLLKTLPETKGRPLEDTIKARSHLSIIVEETELELRVSESAP